MQGPVADDDAGGMGRGIGIQPLQRQSDFQQCRHARLGAGRLAQFRLALDGFLQGDGLCRVLRDQLGQLIDLSQRQFEDAADIAQDTACQKRTEGDDLRHPVLAIAPAHIGDDLIAPVLAEIDVEIGHRHALGIEKALEQQAETQGIEIGNGQGIGHKRASTGAAARPHRNALRLGELDEIGHDQEIAGKIHRHDDVELKCQALAIVVPRQSRCRRMGGETRFQSAPGLRAQFRHLVDERTAGRCEIRENRFPGARAESAAMRDFHRVGTSLRHVGEQPLHLRPALEPMLGRELASIAGTDKAALGYADERVMGLKIAGFGEKRFIGGDERQALPIGKIDKLRLGIARGLQAVALQFDIEPILKQRFQPLQPGSRHIRPAIGQGAVKRAGRAAGQGNQPGAAALQTRDCEMRRVACFRIQPCARGNPHQIGIAFVILGEQNYAGAASPGQFGARPHAGTVAKSQSELQADDRLYAVLRQLFGKFQRAEQIVSIGDGQGGHLVGQRQFG